MEDAEFIEAQESVINRMLDTVSTCFPATIISPLPDRDGLVNIQPNHKYKIEGDDTEFTPSPINNVVLVEFGRSQRTIIRPPRDVKTLIGAKVLVVICDHDITEWRSSGGKSVYPGENRRFNINDAVAILGLYPETLTWSDPQKPNTFEFLGTSGVKFRIGTSEADFLKIMYDFLDFFQTVDAADGDTLAVNLTAAQPLLLANLKTLLAGITNI